MSKIVDAANGVDRTMDQMIPFFGADLRTTDPRWYISEAEIGVGSQPGYIKIRIPMSADTDDESAYSMVFNPDGMLSFFKHGDAVAGVLRTYLSDGTFRDERQFVGEITKIEQVAEDGGVIDEFEITAQDVRMRLREVRFIGRWVYSRIAQEVTYQQGWGAHFNPGGRPNCIFDSNGNPWFSAHPDEGLGTDGHPADASAQSTLEVCYWTLQNILRYSNNTIGPRPTGSNPIVNYPEIFPYIIYCPDTMIWPASLGSGLDQVAQDNFNNGVGQNFSAAGGARKGRDINLNGLCLCGEPGKPGALDMILEAAGGWTWTCDYGYNPITGEHFTSLKLVQSRWRGPSNGVNIPYAAGGDAKDSLKTPVITGGRYVEDSEFTASRIVASGSLVKIETRCSSRAADHTGGGTRSLLNPGGTGTPALLAGWASEDFELCMRYAAWLGAGHITSDTIQEAFAKFPHVLSSYIVNPNFDFYEGTEDSGKPRAKITRPVMPFLLSFFGGGNSAGDITPYSIRAEVDIDGTPTWQLGPEMDGLEVWDNGIIYMPGLRDVALAHLTRESVIEGSWKPIFTPAGNLQTQGVYNANFELNTLRLDVEVQEIRITLAIACDHRFTYAAKIATDQATSPLFSTIGGESPDYFRLSERFYRTHYLDLNGLYELWLRRNSWPEAQSIEGTTQAPDRLSSGVDASGEPLAVRTDLKMMQSHALRRLQNASRLDREESVLRFDGHLVAAYAPGTVVNQLIPRGIEGRKPFDARFVVGRKRYICHAEKGVRGMSFKTCTEIYPM
jgi:hypothetical protein